MNDVPNEVKDIIFKQVMVSAAAAPVGAFIPCLDQAAVVSSWGYMLGSIASYYDKRLSPATITQIVASAGAGIGAYMFGSKLMTWAVTFVFTGPAGPAVVNAALNGYFTKSVGYAMNEIMRTDYINGRTALEIGKRIAALIVPVPSLSDLKEMYNLIKEGS